MLPALVVIGASAAGFLLWRRAKASADASEESGTTAADAAAWVTALDACSWVVPEEAKPVMRGGRDLLRDLLAWRPRKKVAENTGDVTSAIYNHLDSKLARSRARREVPLEKQTSEARRGACQLYDAGFAAFAPDSVARRESFQLYISAFPDNMEEKAKVADEHEAADRELASRPEDAGYIQVDEKVAIVLMSAPGFAPADEQGQALTEATAIAKARRQEFTWTNATHTVAFPLVALEETAPGNIGCEAIVLVGGSRREPARQLAHLNITLQVVESGANPGFYDLEPRVTPLDSPAPAEHSYDVFINYRVNTDKDLAELVCYELLALGGAGAAGGTRVFWDKKDLEDGLPWEEGFKRGLRNSRHMIALISPAALEGIKRSLDPGASRKPSRPGSEPPRLDNVLLEYELAIARNEADPGFVIPLWVGFDGRPPKAETFPDVISASGHNARDTLRKLFEIPCSFAQRNFHAGLSVRCGKAEPPFLDPAKVVELHEKIRAGGRPLLGLPAAAGSAGGGQRTLILRSPCDALVAEKLRVRLLAKGVRAETLVSREQIEEQLPAPRSVVVLLSKTGIRQVPGSALTGFDEGATAQGATSGTPEFEQVKAACAFQALAFKRLHMVPIFVGEYHQVTIDGDAQETLLHFGKSNEWSTFRGTALESAFNDERGAVFQRQGIFVDPEGIDPIIERTARALKSPSPNEVQTLSRVRRHAASAAPVPRERAAKSIS